MVYRTTETENRKEGNDRGKGKLSEISESWSRGDIMEADCCRGDRKRTIIAESEKPCALTVGTRMTTTGDGDDGVGDTLMYSDRYRGDRLRRHRQTSTDSLKSMLSGDRSQ